MKRSGPTHAGGSTIDGYVAALGGDKRAAFESLRNAIKAAAPEAEECFSYGMPAFRLHGKVLVCLAAWANHCALYPMGGAVIRLHRAELARYDTSKGTIRFPLDATVPRALVLKLVKARVALLSAGSPPTMRSRSSRPPTR